MKKQKILIIMKTMNIGGAERSLIGLLNAVDYHQWEVNLMLLKHEGEFLSLIPTSVNLLSENEYYSNYEKPIKKVLFSGHIKLATLRLIAKLHCLVFRKLKKVKRSSWLSQQYTHKYLTSVMPKVEGDYDLAINFLGVPDILLNKVLSNKKICWVHTDYEKITANRSYDLDVYSGMDYIVNVSEDCKKVFDCKYPSLVKKSVAIENILSKKDVMFQSDIDVDCFEMKNNSLQFLSIGRYSKAKNFENVPSIARLLRENGISFKWYIIGYGAEEELIKERIIKEGVEDIVILLGKKANPYPYLKVCDVYIQPSRYEGKSVSVREAQILGKLVIITNYTTSKSQVNSGVDGVIVPLENQACAEGIRDTIVNEELCLSIRNYCKSHEFGNEFEIEKLAKLGMG